jgi:hypothetical protein
VRRVSVCCAVVASLVATRADARNHHDLKKGPYLQNVTATSVVILWETGDSAAATLQVTGPGVDRTIELSAARLQEVVVDGLAPSTRYTYQVKVGEQVEDGELATAPIEGASVPFTFIVYGDTRSQIDSHRRIVRRLMTEVPDFLLGTGDMVDEGGKESQWQDFFEIERPLLRDNVLFPAVGNHDRQGRGRTVDSWRSYFSVPANSPDPERYYAYRYGNALVLVLDSNMYSFALTDQTSWIERQLQAAAQDATVRHTFVVMHHPPFSISLHGGQRDLRERWVPLFEKYGVDAVFSGHDHVYSRAEKGGIHYYVSGGGGAPLYPRSPRAQAVDKQAVKMFERVNHYLRIHVYGEQVEVTAVRVDGTVIETTSWGAPPAPAELAAVVKHAPAAPPRAGAAPPPIVAVVTPPRHERSLGWPLGLGMIGVLSATGVVLFAARRRRS